MTTIFLKDPNAVLDYYWDWKALTNNGSSVGDWLADGETISSYTVTAESGLTKASDALINSSTTVQAWLSGGTVGQQYGVTCHIVTSAGRTDDRTSTIVVEQR